MLERAIYICHVETAWHDRERSPGAAPWTVILSIMTAHMVTLLGYVNIFCYSAGSTAKPYLHLDYIIILGSNVPLQG